MMRPFMASLVMGIAMAVSSGAAMLITPTERLADRQAAFSLEEMIPTSFGDWRIDTSLIPLEVAPDVLAKLNAIYNQSIARTYRNNQGQRIMLLIAYGGDQSGEGTQVHRPEFCYTAQGFRLVNNNVGKLSTPNGDIPIRRMKAVQASRIEPITYWITVGDKATLPGIGRLWARISYGINGLVADAMLVRISAIEPDEAHAYQLQDQFINQLLLSIDSPSRLRLTGDLNNQSY